LRSSWLQAVCLLAPFVSSDTTRTSMFLELYPSVTLKKKADLLVAIGSLNFSDAEKSRLIDLICKDFNSATTWLEPAVNIVVGILNSKENKQQILPFLPQLLDFVQHALSTPDRGVASQVFIIIL
jgi:hypothetical protein